MPAIRAMTIADTDTVLEMMKTFYSSSATCSNGSEEIFRNSIAACTSANPYLEGYVFTDASKSMGYAILAKSFSVEFGKACIWIEDLYLDPALRGKGMASQFLKHVESKYPDAVLRLEVSNDNTNAIRIYETHGFVRLPYLEMKKDLKNPK